MVKRWILYLTVWGGCLIFYYAYREWAAWMLLVSVTLLPPFSLLISLPAIITARMRLSMPGAVTVGTVTPVNLQVHCPLPAPRWNVRIVGHQVLTGKNWLLYPGYDCPTDHCGALDCKLSRGRIYDYLGLFCFPMRTPRSFRLLVRPRPVPVAQLPRLEEYIASAWRPKPGGGFAENHELRLYRPGDSLRQIHWKLSAKTGELVYREPMEPNGSRILLWLIHSGDADLLDKKLGKLLWISNHLQQRGLKHDILAYTAQGQQRWRIGTRHTLAEALDALLSQPPMVDAEPPVHKENAMWQFYIGGDDLEKV